VRRKGQSVSNKVLVDIGTIGVLAALAVTEASAEVMRWQVNGATREAIVQVPDTAATGEPLPLVLSFHGYGDNMENFQYTNVHVAWPDAVVVYFQGLERSRGLRGWVTEPGRSNRDLALVDVALASLKERFRIDDGRIYATGYSNGGGFTYLLWSERADVFAGFAPVAARFRDGVRPELPRPVFVIAGDQDRVVDFEDQQEAFELAIDVNSVRDESVECGNGCTLYGAETTAPVMVWVHHGAHVYPRGASEGIATFFRRYGR
jgi:polyhydroxybutyrate depolymerase